MKIIPYEEQYDSGISAMDPMKLSEMKWHGDVLPESRILCVDDGEFLGCGYLCADADFYLKPEAVRGKCYIRLEYQSIPGDPREVEASACLLEALMDRFDELSDSMPERKLVLRTWAGAEKTGYMEFLFSYGFQAGQIFPVFVKEFSEEEAFSEVSEKIDAVTKNGTDCEIVFQKTEMNEKVTEQYLTAFERAFGHPQSRNELGFRLAGPDTSLFTAMHGDRIIASLTTWPTGERSAATEDIFCDPDYRQLGITGALIRYAMNVLRKEGKTEFSLSVYGTNLKAISLYMKLGYEMKSSLVEMTYTTE